MADSLVPSFRDAPEISLVGLRRSHDLATADKTIPQQWRDFMDSGQPGVREAAITYGVTLGVDRGQSGTMDYMAAIETHPGDKVSGTADRATIAPATYAVFTVEGLDGLREGWPRIYKEWLPSSGQKLAKAPAFERYDDRFVPTERSGQIELWVPIERSPTDA